MNIQGTLSMLEAAPTTAGAAAYSIEPARRARAVAQASVDQARLFLRRQRMASVAHGLHAAS
jgi:hypothetical protein